MLQVKASKNLLGKCRRFLAQNPTVNVLPLGDSYPPLSRKSTLYTAVEDKQIVGVCSVYQGLSKPSVVLGTTDPKIKKVLLKRALKQVSGEFISLCSIDEIEIFKENAKLLHMHTEQQMIADPPKQVKCGDIKVTRVHKDELEQLNRFYIEHNSDAWTPLQFKVGPYYCVKQDGKIVSAAGVHVMTPQIAQLGNIVTDEAHQNRGFATACTSTLAADLASKGRIISLFVRTENKPAIHMYEKLGFTKKREVAFVIMRKNVQTNHSSAFSFS
jgi:ribosomal protein S18 acetylase RimI-like enzyme